LNSSFGGQVAFSSAITGAASGFFIWTIEKDWLQGLSMNNVTLWLNPLNPIDGEAHSLGGLNLGVTNKPAEYYRQPPTPAPTGQSLYIALPSVAAFVILCVCGGAIINRKHRKIGLGNVMGRRNGYGVGKSRRQRLGLRKKKDGAIQLRDQELTAGGQYRDVPPPEEGERQIGHVRADSDGLGSLAGTPTEERTNYFRDEMQRQERNRY
jgi:Ykl077w/Psg1 (Pma1 Stabilization in Golgi)